MGAEPSWVKNNMSQMSQTPMNSLYLIERVNQVGNVFTDTLKLGGGRENWKKSHWGHCAVQRGEVLLLCFTTGSDFHQRKRCLSLWRRDSAVIQAAKLIQSRFGSKQVWLKHLADKSTMEVIIKGGETHLLIFRKKWAEVNIHFGHVWGLGDAVISFVG